MQPLIHPALMTRNKHFYPALATIQQPDGTVDAAGQPVPGWTTLHANVPCRVSPNDFRQDEVRTQDQTYTVGPFVIALAGSYPSVQPPMRVVVGGVTYDITQVRSDGSGASTYLDCKVVA